MNNVALEVWFIVLGRTWFLYTSYNFYIILYTLKYLLMFYILTVK